MNQSEVQQAILQTIASVPKGRVCSYGMIAKLAGVPGQARYVGYLLKNLPDATAIPWHRIVNSQGRSSFPVDSAQFTLQISLLKSEDIIFTSDNAINLKKYLWLGC